MFLPELRPDEVFSQMPWVLTMSGCFFSCSPISRLVLPLCRRLGGILGQGQGRLLSREAEPRHPGCWRLASTVLSQNTSPVHPWTAVAWTHLDPTLFIERITQTQAINAASWLKILERSFSEWLCDILTRQSQIHESKTDDGECILLDLIYMIYIWSMDRYSRTRLQIPLKTTLLIAWGLIDKSACWEIN